MFHLLLMLGFSSSWFFIIHFIFIKFSSNWEVCGISENGFLWQRGVPILGKSLWLFQGGEKHPSIESTQTQCRILEVKRRLGSRIWETWVWVMVPPWFHWANTLIFLNFYLLTCKVGAVEFPPHWILMYIYEIMHVKCLFMWYPSKVSCYDHYFSISWRLIIF